MCSFEIYFVRMFTFSHLLTIYLPKKKLNASAVEVSPRKLVHVYLGFGQLHGNAS